VQALREGRVDDRADPLVVDFTNHLETFLKLLKPVAAKAPSAPLEPEEGQRILDLLERLEPLLQSRDTQANSLIEPVIDQLLAMGDGAQQLVHQVEGFDYEAALTTLREFRGKLEGG